MSHVIVGYCPRCGSPIYSPQVWMGVTPPPASYSCACFESARTYVGTSTNPQQLSIPVEGAEDNHALHTLVDVQEARIKQLEEALEKERSSKPAHDLDMSKLLKAVTGYIDMELKKIRRTEG